MASPSSPPGKTETLIGVAILLGLAGIAAYLVLRQVNYSSPWLADLDASISASPAKPTGKEGDLAAYAGTGMTAMSPMESFTPDTLYEKIDGQAELYLTAGVVALRCQRLAMVDNPEAWFEVSVYEMGNSDNAFTVYSKQRRPEGRELDEAGYRTANSLYFVCGRFYVEMVAAVSDKPVIQAMLGYRQRFASAVGSGVGQWAAEVALFPRQHLRAGSISRSGEDDFGVPGFASVFLAVYDVGGKDVTAFLSRRSSAQEAADLAAAYADSFRPFGAHVEPAGAAIPGGSLISLLDEYKMVFSRGPFVAGVHQSTDRAAAEKVAAMLYAALPEAN